MVPTEYIANYVPKDSESTKVEHSFGQICRRIRARCESTHSLDSLSAYTEPLLDSLKLHHRVVDHVMGIVSYPLGREAANIVKAQTETREALEKKFFMTRWRILTWTMYQNCIRRREKYIKEQKPRLVISMPTYTQYNASCLGVAGVLSAGVQECLPFLYAKITMRHLPPEVWKRIGSYLVTKTDCRWMYTDFGKFSNIEDGDEVERMTQTEHFTSRVTKLSLAIELFALWLGNPRVSYYLRCEAKESRSGDSVRSGTQVGASVRSTDAPMGASMPDEA